jgi:hypothetical protein
MRRAAGKRGCHRVRIALPASSAWHTAISRAFASIAHIFAMRCAERQAAGDMTNAIRRKHLAEFLQFVYAVERLLS